MTHSKNWAVDNGALSIDGQIVATWIAPDFASIEENKANIILASAAPDILLALEIAIEFLTGRSKEIAEEAIAKAKGTK